MTVFIIYLLMFKKIYYILIMSKSSEKSQRPEKTTGATWAMIGKG